MINGTYKKITEIYRCKQQGFSLIELAVGVAISSFIIGGTFLCLHQMVFMGNDVREDMISTQYVQNTGKWLRQDVLMSQAISPGDNPTTVENETMTLYWVSASYKDAQDNDCIDNYEVSYYLDGEELRRKEQITTKVYNSTGGLIETIEEEGITLVSDDITGFAINSDNVTLALSITSGVGDAETEKTYEISPRAGHI